MARAQPIPVPKLSAASPQPHLQLPELAVGPTLPEPEISELGPTLPEPEHNDHSYQSHHSVHCADE